MAQTQEEQEVGTVDNQFMMFQTIDKLLTYQDGSYLSIHYKDQEVVAEFLLLHDDEDDPRLVCRIPGKTLNGALTMMDAHLTEITNDCATKAFWNDIIWNEAYEKKLKNRKKK